MFVAPCAKVRSQSLVKGTEATWKQGIEVERVMRTQERIMESAATDAVFDNYLLGRTLQEHQRLRGQAEIWEGTTRRILRELGLREGMSCLDVGCGPGEVMRLLGQIVGPSGHVTGVDIDGGLGLRATEELNATGTSQFHFVEGNVEEIDEIGHEHFDLTLGRIVLIHLEDAIATLRKMYSWTKPGGLILVQEFDFRTWDIYPRIQAWEELQRVCASVFWKTGRDTRIGHKLPVYFVEAEIGEPDGTDVSGRVVSLEQSLSMIQSTYRSFLSQALKLGLTTEDKSEGFLTELERAPRQRYYFSLSPLLVSAWKRKS